MASMTHGKTSLATLTLFVLAFTASTVSRADTLLFSNFGPGMSYDTAEGNAVGNAFDGSLYAEGDTFTPMSTAKFGSLDIALSCLFAGGCADPFTVSLRTNSGDAPGSVLESFSVLGSSLGMLGSNNAPLVLSSILNPTLTAGVQYWVAVTADANDSIAWNLNVTGDASDQAISSDGGATWFSPSGLTPGAYEINGVSSASPVPEPSSLLLLATSVGIPLVRTARERMSR
jgi:hypothetical protein